MRVVVLTGFEEEDVTQQQGNSAAAQPCGMSLAIG
jgi:hypothetical protein